MRPTFCTGINETVKPGTILGPDHLKRHPPNGGVDAKFCESGITDQPWF